MATGYFCCDHLTAWIEYVIYGYFCGLSIWDSNLQALTLFEFFWINNNFFLSVFSTICVNISNKFHRFFASFSWFTSWCVTVIDWGHSLNNLSFCWWKFHKLLAFLLHICLLFVLRDSFMHICNICHHHQSTKTKFHVKRQFYFANPKA